MQDPVRSGYGPGGDATVRATAHAAMIQSVMVEHDRERARLRGRIYQLEKIIDGAGLTPLADDGESMAAAYHDNLKAVAAVLDYFGVGALGLDGLPDELYDVFRPLVIT